MQVPGAGAMVLSTLPVSVRSVMSSFSGQLLVLLAAQPNNAKPLYKAHQVVVDYPMHSMLRKTSGVDS